jgi:hypothetical protein
VGFIVGSSVEGATELTVGYRVVGIRVGFLVGFMVGKPEGDSVGWLVGS